MNTFADDLELFNFRWQNCSLFGGNLHLINAGKELLLADKAIILRYGHNFETAHAGRKDNALPTGSQTKILALVCSEITYTYNSHNYIFFANIMNTILVSKFCAIKMQMN